MRRYVVVFARSEMDAELHVNASRHRFDTIKEARNFAADYYNAYIFAVTNDLIPSRVKTRAEINRFKKIK